MTSTTYIKTRAYKDAHGQRPRGAGRWAFHVGPQIVFCSGTFAQACREATRAALAARVAVIEVLP